MYHKKNKGIYHLNDILTILRYYLNSDKKRQCKNVGHLPFRTYWLPKSHVSLVFDITPSHLGSQAQERLPDLWWAHLEGHVQRILTSTLLLLSWHGDFVATKQHGTFPVFKMCQLKSVFNLKTSWFRNGNRLAASLKPTVAKCATATFAALWSTLWHCFGKMLFKKKKIINNYSMTCTTNHDF